MAGSALLEKSTLSNPWELEENGSAIFPGCSLKGNTGICVFANI